MKKYYTPIIFIVLGVSSFITYIIKGSYVAADGTLVESFGFIPVGLVLIVVGVLIGLVISFWSLFRNPKMLDKIVFSILLTGSILFVLYLMIATYYLSKKDIPEYKISDSFNKQTTESLNSTKLSDLKICSSEISGFIFSYPKTWGECEVTGQKISFRTDFKKYNVYLVAEIREASPELAKGFIDYSIKQEKIDGINNASIYRGACGGGVACSVLNIDNQKFYEIYWDVVSNQPVPEDLDGVWVPDYDFTDDDIWSILKSIKMAN